MENIEKGEGESIFGKRWIPVCSGMTEKRAGITIVKQSFTG